MIKTKKKKEKKMRSFVFIVVVLLALPLKASSSPFYYWGGDTRAAVSSDQNSAKFIFGTSAIDASMNDLQEPGINWATAFFDTGGSLDINGELTTWDSGFYDMFSISAVLDGVEKNYTYGGNSWTDQTQEKHSIDLFFQFENYALIKKMLITRWDDFYPTSTKLSMNYTPAANPVPEPSTILLFGAGLAGIFGIQRRVKK
jgi:hypothetical protein